MVVICVWHRVTSEQHKCKKTKLPHTHQGPGGKAGTSSEETPGHLESGFQALPCFSAAPEP